MITRIGSVILKEFIQIARDPRTLAIVLIMPIVQLVLFGYAINTVVDHLALVVEDEASDPESRGIIDAFRNTGYFDLAAVATSRTELLAEIDTGRAKAGLIIPNGFGTDLLHGKTGEVQLVIDGSDPNVAQTALFAGGMVGQVRSANLISATLARLGGAGGGVEIRPIVLYNPSMLSVNFMIPGLVGLILQFQTLILTAFAIVRERERGTLEQLLVTPIRPWELMVGKILPYCLTALAAVTVALAVGRIVFGVPISGSVPLLAGLSILFLLGSLGVGMFISTISQTQTQAMQIAIFFLLPAMLLSGFIFPREGMPWIIQQIGLLIPLTYFLQILRGIILKGVGIEVLWNQALTLAVFGLIVFALSAARFQKRLG